MVGSDGRGGYGGPGCRDFARLWPNYAWWVHDVVVSVSFKVGQRVSGGGGSRTGADSTEKLEAVVQVGEGLVYAAQRSLLSPDRPVASSVGSELGQTRLFAHKPKIIETHTHLTLCI